jgi:hypothetical protein
LDKKSGFWWEVAFFIPTFKVQEKFMLKKNICAVQKALLVLPKEIRWGYKKRNPIV